MYILAIKTMWLFFFVTFTSTFARRTLNIISVSYNFTLIPYSRKIIPSIQFQNVPTAGHLGGGGEEKKLAMYLCASHPVVDSSCLLLSSAGPRGL